LSISRDEAAQYLRGLGVEDTGVHALIRAVYHLLGLRTFFTTAKNETRAWTITRRDKALRCRSFHRISNVVLLRRKQFITMILTALGSFAKAREAGKLRLEGKDYVVALTAT